MAKEGFVVCDISVLGWVEGFDCKSGRGPLQGGEGYKHAFTEWPKTLAFDDRPRPRPW
jgi:hypothetical protein